MFRNLKNARPAAEAAAYGVLEGGRAVSGVSTLRLAYCPRFYLFCVQPAVIRVTHRSDSLPIVAARDGHHGNVPNRPSSMQLLAGFASFRFMQRIFHHGLRNH
jgi:hypothetical protein